MELEFDITWIVISTGAAIIAILMYFVVKAAVKEDKRQRIINAKKDLEDEAEAQAQAQAQAQADISSSPDFDMEKFIKRSRAVVVVCLITIAGLWASLEVKKIGKIHLYDVEIYHLFTAYEREKSLYIQESDWKKLVNALVEGETNAGIEAVRNEVFIYTFIIFLLSMYPAYRAYKMPAI